MILFYIVIFLFLSYFVGAVLCSWLEEYKSDHKKESVKECNEEIKIPQETDQWRKTYDNFFKIANQLDKEYKESLSSNDKCNATVEYPLTNMTNFTFLPKWNWGTAFETLNTTTTNHPIISPLGIQTPEIEPKEPGLIYIKIYETSEFVIYQVKKCVSLNSKITTFYVTIDNVTLYKHKHKPKLTRDVEKDLAQAIKVYGYANQIFIPTTWSNCHRRLDAINKATINIAPYNQVSEIYSAAIIINMVDYYYVKYNMTNKEIEVQVKPIKHHKSTDDPLVLLFEDLNMTQSYFRDLVEYMVKMEMVGSRPIKETVKLALQKNEDILISKTV